MSPPGLKTVMSKISKRLGRLSWNCRGSLGDPEGVASLSWNYKIRKKNFTKSAHFGLDSRLQLDVLYMETALTHWWHTKTYLSYPLLLTVVPCWAKRSAGAVRGHYSRRLLLTAAVCEAKHSGVRYSNHIKAYLQTSIRTFLEYTCTDLFLPSRGLCGITMPIH